MCVGGGSVNLVSATGTSFAVSRDEIRGGGEKMMKRSTSTQTRKAELEMRRW